MSINIEQFLPIFVTEAQDHLALFEESMSILADGQHDMETINQLFRSAHTLKGGAGMYDLDRLVVVAHETETLLDQLREDKLSVSEELVEILFEAQDWLFKLVQAIEDNQYPEEEKEKELISRLQSFSGAEVDAIEKQSVQKDSTKSEDSVLTISIEKEACRQGLKLEPIMRELDDLFEIINVNVEYSGPNFPELDPTEVFLSIDVEIKGTPQQAELDEVFSFAAGLEWQLEEKQQQASQDEERVLNVNDTSENTEPPSQKKKNSSSTNRDNQVKNNTKFVKVNVDKLDRLVNDMGELLTTKAKLAVLAQRYHDLEIDSALDEFERSMNQIRDASLSLRLVPLNETFIRFHSIVRESARAIGKSIKLVISGGETELDRIAAEKLVDPLIHIIRNSCDHGVETPEKRIDIGKPKEGTIRLSAEYIGGRVIISVKDDGKGLQKEKIFKKAVENKIISEDEMLDEKQIYQLVFRPGFSTAEKVTDLSGRGVGMDVVRRQVNELGGHVEIDSVLGTGTTLKISLPLTTAIMDGFAAAVGQQMIIIPINKIIECIPKDEFNLRRVKGQDCFFMRGEYIPTIDVAKLIGVEVNTTQPECLIVDSQYGRLALIFESLRGELQAVVKPMGPVLSICQYFSGLVTLGTGELAFVLDINTLATKSYSIGESGDSRYIGEVK